MRKSNRFSIFGGSFAQTAATGAAKPHFLRHWGAALGTKLAARAVGAEIFLRLHIGIAAADLKWRKIIRTDGWIGCEFLRLGPNFSCPERLIV